MPHVEQVAKYDLIPLLPMYTQSPLISASSADMTFARGRGSSWEAILQMPFINAMSTKGDKRDIVPKY